MSGISKTDLLTQVSNFCAESGLQDKELVFQKGALVAQNPQGFEDIAELTEDDKYHLRREVTSMPIEREKSCARRQHMLTPKRSLATA